MAAFWKPTQINRSNRPVLFEGEFNVFLRENVGLYQGRSKLLDYQNGRVYITNKRVIYVDEVKRENTLALEISEIDRLEFVEGFLRSSPKVKAFLKKRVNPTNTGSINQLKATELRNWVCIICTFSNNARNNVCSSCGIKKMELVVEDNAKGSNTHDLSSNRSLVESESNNEVANGLQTSNGNSHKSDLESDTNKTHVANASANCDPGSKFKNSLEMQQGVCNICTFQNHASMRYCEMCGNKLHPAQIPTSAKQDELKVNSQGLVLRLENPKDLNSDYVKFSFHKGGDSEFYRVLQQQMDELKWENLVSQSKINQNGQKLVESVNSPSIDNTSKQLGIHGLEKIGEHQRKLNELVLSSSLDDLEQLMYKAQDLIKLSSSFSKLIKPIPGSQTRAIIPQLKIKKSSKLYHRELSRHISEYLLNFQLKKAWNIVTMQDLFASYNRYLSFTQGFGTDLVSASDILKATELFEELKLPFYKHKYENSGIVVIKSIKQEDFGQLITDYLFQNESDSGKSLGQISDKFEWTYVVAQEEIDNCIRCGTIVIDENISGIFYYVNKFTDLHSNLKIPN